MYANQREIDLERRLQALEEEVFGEHRGKKTPKPLEPVDRTAAIRRDALRARAGKEPEAPTIIDLNTASLEELATVVGEPEHVVSLRPLESVDDLLKIPGVGPKTVDAIRPKVSVGKAQS